MLITKLFCGCLTLIFGCSLQRDGGNQDGNSSLRSRSLRSHKGLFLSSDDLVAVQNGNARVHAAEPVIVGGADVQVDSTEPVVVGVKLATADVVVESPFIDGKLLDVNIRLLDADVNLLDVLASCRCSALWALMCSTASKQMVLMSLCF